MATAPAQTRSTPAPQRTEPTAQDWADVFADVAWCDSAESDIGTELQALLSTEARVGTAQRTRSMVEA